MNHLQQDLGALELGALAQVNDAALEDGARAMQGPTQNVYYCRHIEDGTLEATGKDTAAGPSRVHSAATRCA